MVASIWLLPITNIITNIVKRIQAVRQAFHGEQVNRTNPRIELSVQKRSHQIIFWAIEDPVIAPVRCLPSNAAYISALHKLPCGRTGGLSKQSLRICRGRVLNFEQLFGCTLFDDRNCEELNGCDSDADLRAVRTVRLTERNGHMNNWFKTCRALASSLAVRLVHGPATVIVTIILLGSNALPQSDSERLGMSANELARKVVTNELKFQDEDHGHWMYGLEKEESGREQVQEILETSNGSLSRLLSIGGHPLDAKQQQKENQRMQRLVSHPDEQRKITAGEKQEGRTRGALVQYSA